MSESPDPEVPQSETHDSGLDGSSDSTVDTPTIAPDTPRAQSSALSQIFLGTDGLRAGWSLMIYLALLFTLLPAASLVIRQIHSHSHQPLPVDPTRFTPSAVFLSESLMALVVMLSTWIMAKIEGRSVLAYGLARSRWRPRLLAGLAWGLGFLSLLVFALRSMGLLVFNGRLLSGADAFRSGVLWFAGFLAVGFFEEIFFRGYMQLTLARGLSGIYGWLGAPNRQALGFWTSAALLSFGFGFTHKSNPGESPVGLLSAGLIGVVFCLSLWRTGSLWWAIGLHAAWDWAQSFLYGVADSGTQITGRLFATYPAGKPILSGGLTGPEGSIFILPIVVLITAAIVFTLPPSSTNALDDPPALDLA